MTTWNLAGTRHHVFMCNGSSCMRQGAEEVTRAIREEIAVRGADGLIHTTRTLCQGRCEDACVVTVYPEGSWFKQTTPELARRLVNEHLLQGELMSEHLSFIYTDAFMPTGRSVTGIAKGYGK
ncbi:(2Fe-2S) ferredoxin domain-containing protein [Paenibacillus hamazuiensis]|uniref:(2Fe-2S) ferredoxin domain-containing protein n=1 Tax=Paenibacillus hamazuiensis TaxID=2936508 RepID=UPI00200FE898